jgi:hypothetical protein
LDNKHALAKWAGPISEMKRIFALCVVILCCAQLSLSQTTTNETGAVRQEPSSKKIKVFPNPATSVVNVLGLTNCAKANITISDLYGNAVLQFQWEIRNNALNIPISDIASGIYMIRVRSLEESVEAKFYKQ